MKTYLSNKFNIPQNRLLVIHIKDNIPKILEGENKLIENELFILDGTLLYIEDCENIEESNIIKQVFNFY